MTARSYSTYLPEKGSVFPAILPKLTILQTSHEQISSFFIDILPSAKAYYTGRLRTAASLALYVLHEL